MASPSWTPESAEAVQSRPVHPCTPHVGSIKPPAKIPKLRGLRPSGVRDQRSRLRGWGRRAFPRQSQRPLGSSATNMNPLSDWWGPTRTVGCHRLATCREEPHHIISWVGPPTCARKPGCWSTSIPQTPSMPSASVGLRIRPINSSFSQRCRV